MAAVRRGGTGRPCPSVAAVDGRDVYGRLRLDGRQHGHGTGVISTQHRRARRAWFRALARSPRPAAAA